MYPFPKLLAVAALMIATGLAAWPGAAVTAAHGQAPPPRNVPSVRPLEPYQPRTPQAQPHPSPSPYDQLQSQVQPGAPAATPVAPVPHPAPAPAPPPPPQRPPGFVAVVERPLSVTRFALDNAEGQDMLNKALLAYTQRATPAEAWQSLGITPADVVGIKITSGGPGGARDIATKQPLVAAIIRGLMSAGVPPRHIIVWDRWAADMRGAGYPPGPGMGGVTYSAITARDYDKEALFIYEVPGALMWGDADFKAGSGTDMYEMAKEYGTPGGGASGSGSQVSTRSYFANIVSKKCTKIINVPAFVDNPGTGLNGCMASLALGSVDNNRRMIGDGQWGDPAIADILSKDVLAKKVVLHILDATVAQYAGGPKFNPRNTESFGAILLSRDPVAIDTLALERAEKLRKDHKVVPMGKTAAHIKTGESYGLGVAKRDKIQVLKVP
ncbi:DUF362 domain-containing protein [Verrucomicrobia bacterium LW23]|nr:DUF362 domain-containing protein [Verrucomicrobia bacterium LW23]